MSNSDFEQWASLFSGDIFVKIAIYADESGTHDKTGALDGSQVAIVAGFAADVRTWGRLCNDWQVVLRKYTARYFHFYDFAEASRVARGGRRDSTYQWNPYRGWKLEKLDAFLFALARIAGSGNKAYLGGQFDTKGFHATGLPGDAHEGCINWFYESAVIEMKLKWPNLQKPVSFFFDQTDDERWQRTILSVHNSRRKANPIIGEITFADKKLHYPLQAADMLAYRMRQISSKYYGHDLKLPHGVPKLDQRLFEGFAKDEITRLVFTSLRHQ